MKKKMPDEMYEMLQDSNQKSRDIEKAYKNLTLYNKELVDNYLKVHEDQLGNKKIGIFDSEKCTSGWNLDPERPPYFQLPPEAKSGVNPKGPNDYIPITRNQTRMDRFFNEHENLTDWLGKLSYIASRDSVNRMYKMKTNNYVNQKFAPAGANAIEKAVKSLDHLPSPIKSILPQVKWGKVAHHTKTFTRSGLKVVGKNALKAFGFGAGTAMNIHTLRNDTSPFKRALAGMDLIGDRIPYVGWATSLANFLGSIAYERMSDPAKEKLDLFAHNVVFKPLQSLEEKRIKNANNQRNKPHRIIGNRIEAGYGKNRREKLLNINQYKRPNFFKDLFGPKTVVASGGIPEVYKEQPIGSMSGLYSRNALGLQNPDYSKMNAGNMNNASLKEKSIDNSKTVANNFTINIKGSSTNEIINELVPQLKLSLANTAGAAV